jgi:hypothetical protein
MERKEFKLKVIGFAASSAVALVLTGCGGGGGDDDGGGPPGSVDVTAANQDQLARAAAAAAQGGFVMSASPLGGSAAPSPLSLTAVTRSAWLRAPRATGDSAAAGRARIAGVSAPSEEPCLVSGAATFTVDDRDNSGDASVGDVVTVVFNACSDVANETMNGTMSVALTAVPISPRLSFTAGATMTALNFTTPGHAARYDGDVTMSYAEPSATLVTTRLVVGNQLVVQATTVNYSDTFTLRAGHTIDLTYDAAALPPGGNQPGLTTTTANGTVASASAGGYVTVTTLEPMRQYDVDAFPRSGHLDVVGKNGSLQLTVLPAGQVRIDLNANGDSDFEETKTVDWDWIF